jgi:hypothetical protein
MQRVCDSVNSPVPLFVKGVRGYFIHKFTVGSLKMKIFTKIIFDFNNNNLRLAA